LTAGRCDRHRTRSLPVAVFPAGALGSSVGRVGFVVGLGTGWLLIYDYNWNHVGAVVTTHWVSIRAGTQFIYSDR
jgi:hypothetical protein